MFGEKFWLGFHSYDKTPRVYMLHFVSRLQFVFTLKKLLMHFVVGIRKLLSGLLAEGEPTPTHRHINSKEKMTMSHWDLKTWGMMSALQTSTRTVVNVTTRPSIYKTAVEITPTCGFRAIERLTCMNLINISWIGEHASLLIYIYNQIFKIIS